jgi:hypothetical protein
MVRHIAILKNGAVSVKNKPENFKQKKIILRVQIRAFLKMILRILREGNT